MTGRRQRDDSPIEDEPTAIRRKTDDQTGGDDGQPVGNSNQPEGNEGQTGGQPSGSAISRPPYEIHEPARVTTKPKRKYKKTQLGKIFGANVNIGTGESGWTPIDEEHKQTWLGLRREELKKDHQQCYLYGFDTNQLKAIDAVPVFKKEVKAVVGLDNPIHPIFDRQNWRTRETNPANRAHWRIGMGKSGYWEAQNPIVWNILAPILQLASQFVMNSGTCHWWDSLIFGDRKHLDPPAPERFGILRSFHSRPLEEFYSRREAIQSLINNTAGRIKLGIENGFTHGDTGLCRPSEEPGEGPPTFFAFTHGFDPHGKGPIDINISYHMLTPFFREDMTQAEGFALKVFVAQVIIHELGHAMTDLNYRDKVSEHNYNLNELCFEDEALAECGYSVTMANMGLMMDSTNQLPTPFAYFAHAWPRRDVNDISRTGLKYARPSEDYDTPTIFYPVPCKFFEDLCRKDFWDGYVKVYMDTGKALHIGKFAGGGRQKKEVILPGTSRWNARPPPPNYPPVVVVPATRESIMADAIHRGRMQDQVRARAALLTARSSLIKWRARFDRKNKKHDWHDAARERRWRNPQEEVAPAPPGSPFSDLTTSEADEPNPDHQDGNGSDFDYEEVLPFQAPMRFRYIHRTMCQLRYVLSLETMTKPIPINLLLEYLNREIKKFKRRTVGPEEFFQYIKYLATEFQICFDLFEGRHGCADVSYLELGWPSVEELIPQPRPPLPDLHRGPKVFEKDVEEFRNVCLDDDEIWFKPIHGAISNRLPHIDIDMEDVRQFFNANWDTEHQVDADVFIHMVSRCPDLWDLGPPGIMRYVGIDPWVGAKAGMEWRESRPDTEMPDADAEEVSMGGDTTEEE